MAGHTGPVDTVKQSHPLAVYPAYQVQERVGVAPAFLPPVVGKAALVGPSSTDVVGVVSLHKPCGAADRGPSWPSAAYLSSWVGRPPRADGVAG